MTEEEKKQQKAEEVNPSVDDYIQTIKNLKENSVPLEKYQKLEEEKTKLVKALSGEGEIPESAQKSKEAPDRKEIAKKILNPAAYGLSDAEYTEVILQQRELALANGEPDPFLRLGVKATPTPQDVEGAEKVAAAFRAWLDASRDENGKLDNELFLAQRRKGIADDSPLIIARLQTLEQAKKTRRGSH